MVDQEVGHLEVLSKRDSSLIEIVSEVVVDELGTEGGVEGTTVGDKSAGLGNITDELRLGSLELVSGGEPSDLVILEGVNQSVGLVHLLASLGRLIGKPLLLRDFSVVSGSELGLNSVDLIELGLGGRELFLSLLKLSGLLLKHLELGLHNL